MILTRLALLASLCLMGGTAGAQNSELDALELEVEKTDEAKEVKGSTWRAFLEGGAGLAQRRFGGGSDGIARFSADARWTPTITPGLRSVLSVRLDATDPEDPFVEGTVLSLREVYASWQPGSGGTSLEFGRINLRNGPGYGYNPTDFFRDNTLRTITTANPFTLREQRLGVFMLSAQNTWRSGAVAVALAPELQDEGPSSKGFSVDLGATNARERGLLTLSSAWSERLSSQVLLYRETGTRTKLGLSTTALLSDALVAHAELSRARERDLITKAVPELAGTEVSRNRGAIGATFTTSTRMSITGEYLYNGFALDRDGWQRAAAAGPDAIGAYYITAQRLQDNASRRGWFVYVTQRDLLVKNLDLTVLAKFNRSDSSRVFWTELRYRMERLDLALQVQSNTGGPATEFGIIPIRDSAGLIATLHF